MKTIEIQTSKREETGKKAAKNLRKSGQIPCVLYSEGKVTHLNIPENLVNKLIYTPDVHIVLLKIEDKIHKAIIKEIQFHPVTDKVLHMDFMEVFDNKPIAIEIPLEITGNSIGVKTGGSLKIYKRKLKVKGLVKNIPDKLKIDITNLNVGNYLEIKDLKFDNLELLDSPNFKVLGVIHTRLVTNTAEESAENKTNVS